VRDRPKDASWHCHLKRKSLASGPDGDIGRFMRGDGGTAADGGSDGRAYEKYRYDVN
jgi:hypothetical protein